MYIHKRYFNTVMAKSIDHKKKTAGRKQKVNMIDILSARDKKTLKTVRSGVALFFGIMEIANGIVAAAGSEKKNVVDPQQTIDIDYEEIKPVQKLLK